MTTLTAQTRSSDTDLHTVKQVTPSIKLIVFTIGNLNLDLPIESVYKVVDRTPVYSSGLNPVGIAHLSNSLKDNAASWEVTVVDLNWQFFKSSSISESGGYLVIVQTATGEFYGIPVPETPILIEVPLGRLRALPNSYRHADTLEIASHVAVIPQDGTPFTVFLLDFQLLLSSFQNVGVK
jgi:purine-binding chemotaxis protein CheW